MGFPVSLQIALQARGKYGRLIHVAKPSIPVWPPQSWETR